MCGKVFPSSTGIYSKPVERRTRSLTASISNLTNDSALKKLKSTIGRKNMMKKPWIENKIELLPSHSLTTPVTKGRRGKGVVGGRGGGNRDMVHSV